MRFKKFLLFFVILLIISIMCLANLYGIQMASYTKIFYKDNTIIYNSIYGDICKYDLTTDKMKKLLNNLELISAYDYILCKNNEYIEIYNFDGSLHSRLNSIELSYGEIHGNYLYYIYISDSYKYSNIFVINIDTQQHINNLDEIQTSSFRVYDNMIYYEFKDSIYYYDLITANTKEVYKGMYCYFFDIDNKNVFVSDFKRNNKLTIIDTNGFIKETDIKTFQFCIRENMVYYINSVYEDEYYSHKFINIKYVKLMKEHIP